MVSNNLTAKQEKFCQNIAKGEMTQYAAYCDAYNAENMQDDTIYVKASQMCDEDKISIRIKELRQPAIEETTRTLVDILNDIETLRKSGMKSDQKLALDCLKHYAKLCGFEVDKSDITSGGEPMTMNTIQINGKKLKVKMGD